MSSTNKTSHYNLSQYIGTDKPTYLVDYNADMTNIDAGIYAAKNEADTNASSIGDKTSLTTDAKSDLVSAINEVDSHTDTNTTNIGTNTTNIATNTTNIGVMTNLETTNKSNLVGAINELKGNINNFNLTIYDDLTITNATNVTDVLNYLKIATNSDSSLAKIYGTLSYQGTGGQNYFTIGNTTLRPESDITINCAGIIRIRDTNDLSNISTIDLIIRTTGAIEIDGRTLTSGWYGLIILFPCLYFIKDFGDTPISI